MNNRMQSKMDKSSKSNGKHISYGLTEDDRKEDINTYCGRAKEILWCGRISLGFGVT